VSDTPAGLVTATVGVACGLAAFALVAVGWPTVTLGALGLLALAGSLARQSRRLADAGAGALFLALLVAALEGLEPVTALVAAAALACAWTFAHAGVDLRGTLGTAPSGGLELAHLAGTAGLVTVAATVAVLAYGVSLGADPTVALVFLAGAVGLVAALRQ
jgi:hypothetical protein